MTDQESDAATNRLAQETSPYLLQHAHNPVDWYPWGPEAWERARAEDKPVLVSIGYAACHWCHVMERESFEDEEIARQQNAAVVSIKVDREERPDVDEIYMEAVQLLRGQGGWPLNVFCLPDGRPFFGGTYFPPTERMGTRSWPQVLEAVSEAYRERGDQVAEQADRLLTQIGARVERGGESTAGAVPDVSQAMADAADALKQSFDRQHGGFGGAPKFPQPFFLSLLLQYGMGVSGGEARDAEAVEAVLSTLRTMAEGGVYDQLGGGFHRYAVDAEWLVPHFEKMLYDNALLTPIYLEAWRWTGEAFFRRVAEETLDYLLVEMRTAEGAFQASTDADSEGEEGKYFVWSLTEVREVLGQAGLTGAEIEVFARYYDVTAGGNFEGRNILHVVRSVAEGARELGRSEAEVEALLGRGRTALLARRAERVPPATDTKVIVAWNGLAIDALARGGMVLGSSRYVEAAERCASFLLQTLRAEGSGLSRIYAGGRASVAGFLDDYASLADGLLSLYEATGDESWFVAAQSLVEEMIAKFADNAGGGFFTTGTNHEALVARMKPTYDGATASGNSQAARALARLYALTAEGALADRLEAMRQMEGGVALRQPLRSALFLSTMEWLRTHRTVVIVGGPDDPARAAMAAVERSSGTVVIEATPEAASLVPQVRDKVAVRGQATAYVCRGNVCSLPVHTPEALAALLAGEGVV